MSSPSSVICPGATSQVPPPGIESACSTSPGDDGAPEELEDGAGRVAHESAEDGSERSIVLGRHGSSSEERRRS